MPPIDYAHLYEAYWRRPDRFGSHSFGDAGAMSLRVLRVAGSGSLLDVGCGFGGLVHALLREGIDAQGIDVAPVAVEQANRGAPGRFREGSILALPFQDEAFDTVVCTDCLEHLAPDDVPQALHELARVARRTVFIVVSTVADRDQQWHLTIQDRDWWELQAFTAGEQTNHFLRRHPRAMLDVSYESREGEGPSVTLALEKCPITLNAFPRERLLRTRGLHMDMLREPGRRADAHIARYVHASTLVRPNDTILDVACGLGYGSHILHHCSPASRVLGLDIDSFAIEYATSGFGASAEFAVADAERLSAIPDNSVDLVVCFETLEHVPDPDAILREFVRVLTPGGRIIVSVPNQWTDDSGSDPNPHHLHVYTWERLASQLRAAGLAITSEAVVATRVENSLDSTLWLEQAHRQLAGGGMKHANSARALVPIALSEADPFSGTLSSEHAKAPAEWYLATAIKSPLVAIPSNSYRETIFGDAPGNLTAFAGNYDNPYLVRSMVALGMRVARPALLRALAHRVLKIARADSPDAGAALCVLLYDALTHRAPAEAMQTLLARVPSLDAASLPNPAPHALRWRVSNWFAAGLLYESMGKPSQAIDAFERCVSLDVLDFSPLLATKTIEARFRLGILIAPNDLARARDHWKAGVREARRVMQGKVSDGSTDDWANLWGDEDAPLPFALPEASQVIDMAARCAGALRAGSHWQTSPGLAFAQTFHTPAQHARQLAREHDSLRVAWATQRAQIQEQHALIDSLHAEIKVIYAEAKRLEGEWSLLAASNAETIAIRQRLTAAESHAREQAATIQNLRAQGEELLLHREHSQRHIQTLIEEVSRTTIDRDTWLAEAQRVTSEWTAVRESLDVLRSDFERVHAELVASERTRQADHAASIARVTSLDIHISNLDASINSYKDHIADLKAHLSSLDAQLTSITAQVRSLRERTGFRALRSLHLVNDIAIEPKTNGTTTPHAS